MSGAADQSAEASVSASKRMSAPSRLQARQNTLGRLNKRTSDIRKIPVLRRYSIGLPSLGSELARAALLSGGNSPPVKL